ncbi:MAG: AAA family ATPase, partial [Gemmatales bacterium]|nr:AAA family ATPase [Gemmatales bacterium]MDW8387062.1 AAA family ATPase [Gemmatales bacterium]
MLKRLELIGFKSFAERTVFEFGPGITAIVGPNGSGKSNIVDAVRWILGEQSAKSLRGGEMADVIFNGSSTRRSLGFAEVTLTLDNTRRLLAIDTDEVQITRRVYRSGEGEYLINRQPSRLRDIKELFLGSGAGAEAYCVIAQGRIEAILQASTKERRVIFEEAAGISRFKAKKIETLRKLEQADQNLLRVRDVLEEVDRQLKSVKQQAAKAQRYQEFMGRLREVRLTLALHEYQTLTQQLDVCRQALDEARYALEQQGERVQAGEEQARTLEEHLTQTERRLRDAESAVADARRRITAAETVLEHERDRLAATEQELTRLRGQDFRLGQQLAGLRVSVQEVEQQLSVSDATCRELAEAASKADAALRHVSEALGRLRKRSEQHRSELLEHFQAATRLHNEQVSLQTQLTALRQHRRRLEQQNSQAA